MSTDRRRLQNALRLGALAFVVAWLFSQELQLRVPFWVPFALLLAAELEFLVRGWRDGGAADVLHRPDAERRAPDHADADLGWGEVIEDDEGLRYIPPPVRAPRTGSRRIAALAAIAIAIGLFVAALRVDRAQTWQALPAATRARVEVRLSHEASRIAGTAVTVRCDDEYRYTGVGSDALGVAFIDRGLAYLQPSVCRTLHDLLEGDDRRAREVTGQAVLVLAHEAVHLAGERNEGITECKALQTGVGLGERLGLSLSDAARLMADRLARNLAERSITRSEYRLPRECRDGGSLDLSPGGDRFP